ncbi:hypothetical protein M2267_001036 [Ensifer sp. KUDG1]
MELTYNSVSFSLTSVVVIVLIIAVFQPRLLPAVIEAIKDWGKR